MLDNQNGWLISFAGYEKPESNDSGKNFLEQSADRKMEFMDNNDMKGIIWFGEDYKTWGWAFREDGVEIKDDVLAEFASAFQTEFPQFVGAITKLYTNEASLLDEFEKRIDAQQTAGVQGFLIMPKDD